MMFRETIRTVAAERKSNIILALDLTSPVREGLLDLSLKLLGELNSLLCAVKINRHLLLPVGLYGGVDRVVDYAHRLGIPAIMDCKVNDIGETNRVIAENYFDAGFDALTASPLPGWEEGLEPVITLAKRKGRGVILLVYMSSRGAEEVYGRMVLDSAGGLRPQYELFAERAAEWDVDGMVVGATRPEKIAEIHRLLKGRVPIYAPGVGAQGGSAQNAVKSGADYLIVGRSILAAADPVRVAREIRDLAWAALVDRGVSALGLP